MSFRKIELVGLAASLLVIALVLSLAGVGVRMAVAPETPWWARLLALAWAGLGGLIVWRRLRTLRAEWRGALRSSPPSA